MSLILALSNILVALPSSSAHSPPRKTYAPPRGREGGQTVTIPSISKTTLLSPIPRPVPNTIIDWLQNDTIMIQTDACKMAQSG